MSTSAAAPARPAALGGWLAIAALVIAIDQLTKLFVVQAFQLGEALPLTSFFNLVRVHNSGAAFSFLAGESGWQRWFFVLLAAAASVFIVWMLRRHAGEQTLFAWALSLILGGALGNVIDRVLHGHVVDFLDVHWAGRHFPAFNVADIAISIGAALLILDELRRMRRGSADAASS